MKINFFRRVPMGMVLGIAIGAAAGFAVYKFIGCRTGACPITANPYTSVVYGALMGFLFTLPK
jgi:hypothetical protein